MFSLPASFHERPVQKTLGAQGVELEHAYADDNPLPIQLFVSRSPGQPSRSLPAPSERVTSEYSSGFVAGITESLKVNEIIEPASPHSSSTTPEPAQSSPSGASAFKDDKEKAIAEYLEARGQKVRPNPQEGAPGAGRQGDAYVDNVKTEFKTLDPGAQSGTVKNVVNNSIKGGGQAREIVIDTRGSGLSEAAAQEGAGRALGVSRGKLDGVTIIGDGYFFRWTPR